MPASPVNSNPLVFTYPELVAAGTYVTGRGRFSTVPVGSVAYGSFGNATTLVNGTIYFAEVFIPRAVTLTGVAALQGGTVGSNNLIGALYSSDGTLVANSALAGIVTVGANTFLPLPFTSTYAAVPGRYWIGVQGNGTTDNIRTVATATFIDAFTGSTTGTFGTLTAITPSSTVTANVGPIAYVYV